MTFYSNSVEAYFLSDTGETRPGEAVPANIPTLPTDQISFGRLHRSLAKAGYDDATEFSPSSGVDVEFNSDAQPFGPPEAPRGAAYYYVAVDRRGDIRDLFISAVDGAVYPYHL